MNIYHFCVYVDVWKTGSMKHCPTPERPQIVENFVHQLLSGGQISEGQVRGHSYFWEVVGAQYWSS